MRNFSLDGTPLPHEQQDYSDYSSLTSVFERISVDYFNLLALEPNRLLRTRHIRTNMHSKIIHGHSALYVYMQKLAALHARMVYVVVRDHAQCTLRHVPNKTRRKSYESCRHPNVICGRVTPTSRVFCSYCVRLRLKDRLTSGNDQVSQQ